MMIFPTCTIFQNVTLKFFFSVVRKSHPIHLSQKWKKKKEEKRDPRKVLKQGNKFNFSSYLILKLNSILANFIKKLMIKIFLFLVREQSHLSQKVQRKKWPKESRRKNWEKGNFNLFVSCNKFDF